MCGISGFVSTTGDLTEKDLTAAAAMSHGLGHRGPDSDGLWNDTHAVFAHRRLAIVDLSPAGHQPMKSQTERYILSYNGEIYNHADLRADLHAAGCAFRGQSDSETLIEAIAHWGIDAVLPRLNGIFAFAVWDRKDRVLMLARDRHGVKPLYWCATSSGVAFGSELGACRHAPGVTSDLDPYAIAAFLRYGNIPAPATPFRDTYKLMPGGTLRLRPNHPPELGTFWDAGAAVSSAQSSPVAGDPEALMTDLEACLTTAVERQMMSDVPLGAFLSGGIDSSLITSLMQKISGRPVETFSIGFDEQGYDEAPAARAVATHLGTKHTEIRVTPAMLLDRIPDVLGHQSEPFGDYSILPTVLLSEAARNSVTVALSGDGGDELFAGYTRHIWARRMDKGAGSRMGRLLGTALGHVPQRAFAQIGRLMPGNNVQFAHKVQKAAAALSARNGTDLHRLLLSAHAAPYDLLAGSPDPTDEINPVAAQAAQLADVDPVTLAQFLDLTVYMPDDVLTKVDRASMAASLEVRVPFLDTDVVDLAWRLPQNVKLRGRTGKWILREILRKHVPADIVDRPKAGFTVPLAGWLRGPLRDWAQDTLFAPAIDRAMLDRAAVQKIWTTHLSGQSDHSALLWNMLTLTIWRATLP
ncbi:asparagine synthase (glutamine-hydrolyzing) [Roseobacter sp.]|uniref:asparagine synthase (glutamine-hydrolyzing) n=1 Tax=Roseobacter sp. TaxID=1907202 RepID=UPI003297B35B